MTTIQERLLDDLKAAMREGDATRREALRMLRAAILNEEIEIQKRVAEKSAARQGPSADAVVPVERRALGDDDVIRVIERLVKRHQDSIEQFRTGGRDDLVAHEEAQLAVIRAYLPQQLGREEIEARVRAAIAETGAKERGDMGKVMGRLSGELRGKADMGQVSRLVQELLGA